MSTINTRLKAIDLHAATGKAKDLLDAVKAKLGLVPNMARVMANSPEVLESYVHFSGALGHGALSPKIREQIALLVAQQNHCNYCLSAHTLIGKLTGLTPAEILDSRKGFGETAHTTAGLVFAEKVLKNRGGVAMSDFAAVREAGFSDGEIAEIIAHVALNVFTNYFNVANEVEIDFPAVSYTAIA